MQNTYSFNQICSNIILKIVLLFAFTISSCSNTPTFEDGHYRPSEKITVDLTVRVNRERTVLTHVAIDTTLILVPYQNSDTSQPVVSFIPLKRDSIDDQEELTKQITFDAGLDRYNTSDLTITVPRSIAEIILIQL